MKKNKNKREIEKEYRTKIRYFCSKRGWVEQEVWVRRYKAIEPVEPKYEYSFLKEEEEEKTND